MWNDYRGAAGLASLRGMIAWLSVCVLSAAWGPELEPSIRTSFAFIGLCGLVAAVVVEIARRVSVFEQTSRQQKTAERRVERSVATISARSPDAMETGQSVQRIVADDRLRETCPRVG